MSETETPAKKAPSRRRTPRWEWALFAVFGLVAVVVFALPPAVRWAAEDWLRQQGADTVKIADVRINLFRGQAALVGLYVREGDFAPLEVANFGVTFSWRALFERRAEITDISLSGARVPVVLDGDGAVRVGIALPGPRPADAAESAEPAGEPWGFALRSVRIDDSEVSLTMPEYSGSWRVQHLALTDLVSWRPAEEASLQLDSRLNDSDLHVEAQLQPFSDPLRVQASVQLAALELGELAQLAGDRLQALAGELHVDMNLQVEHGADGLRLSPEGELRLAGVRVTDPAGRQVAADLHWRGKAALGLRDGVPTVDADGTLNLADVALEDAAQQLALKLSGVQWQGKAGYKVSKGEQDVRVQGRLSARAIDARSGGQTARLDGVQWDGGVAYSAGAARQDVRLQGLLSASGLDARNDVAQAVRLGALRWQAEGSVALPKEGEPQLAFSGPLQFEQVGLEAPAHQVGLAGAKWDGSGEIRLGETPHPKVSGTLQADGFSLLQKAGELRLARFGTLQVDGLQVDGLDQQVIGAVRIADVEALKATTKKRPEVLRLQRLETGPVQRQAQRVDVGLVTLDGLVADVLRRKDGSIATLAEVQAPGAVDPGAAAGPAPAECAPAPAADAAAAATEAPPQEVSAPPEPLRIVAQGLRVTGDSRLRFADRRVKPRFSTEYLIEKLQVGALDTGAPDAETPVELALRTPGEGRLTLQGSGRFLQDPPSAQLALTGRSLELANLSPYTIQTIGYEFGSGQMNLDTTVKVDAGKIRGENKIHLRRFTMEKANASAAEKLARNLTMSLESALSLLRDSEGDIKLKIPLRGDLANPEVDVQDAINKALGKAVRKAALSYLKYTLQPYGSLITVVEVLGKAGEKLTALKLAPVEFAAGAVEPDATGQAYLAKVADMLKQRPEVTVKLCGIATPADQAALNAAGQVDAPNPDAAGADSSDGESSTLREIAESRSLAVKKLLVGEMGVKASQLFLCAPKVLDDDGEKPSVEMQV